MYEYIVLIFLASFLVKAVDFIVDEKIKVKYLDIILGVIYGFLIALVASGAQIFASLIFAVIIAVALTKKIDSISHMTWLMIFIVFIFILGMPKLDINMLIVFLVAAVADEITSDLSDNKKIKGIKAKIFKFRPFMDITAFTVSAITSQWILFLGTLSSEAGYKISEISLYRIYKSKRK